MLGHAWGAFGEPAKAWEILVDLQDLGKQGYVRAFGVAMIYPGLGDRDQALAWRRAATTAMSGLSCSKWIRSTRIYEPTLALSLC
jgi:hypothetical protein